MMMRAGTAEPINHLDSSQYLVGTSGLHTGLAPSLPDDVVPSAVVLAAALTRPSGRDRRDGTPGVPTHRHSAAATTWSQSCAPTRGRSKHSTPAAHAVDLHVHARSAVSGCRTGGALRTLPKHQNGEVQERAAAPFRSPNTPCCLLYAAVVLLHASPSCHPMYPCLRVPRLVSCAPSR
jgi:hypothetical protein